jgi:hypothetical protein
MDMTEETQVTEGTESKTYTEAEVEAMVKDRLDSKMRNPIEQITTLKAELDGLRQQRDAEERAKLEEEGKLKELLEKERNDMASLKAQLEEKDKAYQRKELSSNLDRALEREGIDNQYTRQGILGEYLQLEERPEVVDYINALKESQPDIFGAPAPASTGTKNQAVGTATQRGGMTDEKADEMLKSSDPEVRKQGSDYWHRKYSGQA